MSEERLFELEIARMRIEVRGRAGLLEPGSEHEPFRVDPGEAVDLRLAFSDAARWEERGPQRFSGHEAMALYDAASGSGWILTVECGRTRRCEATFSQDYSEGRVRFTPWPPGRTLQNLPRAWEYACISRLARLGGGFLVHAVGLALPDLGGVLLPGSSGRGKSTLAELHDETETLSDERVAVAPGADGRTWIWGTPWRGTAGRVRAAGVPLAATVFLGPHEPPFGLTPVRPAEAFRRLAFHGFPPFWDRLGLERTIDRALEAAVTLPAFELRYQPGPGARAWLRERLERVLC